MGGTKGGLVLATALMLTGCGASPEEKAAEASASATQAAELAKALAPKIRYEVGGETDMASITIQTPTGSSQQSDIDVPLQTKGGYSYLEFTFSAGDFVYLSAQNSRDRGTVTCKITTESGRVISENQASGEYAIATCQGRAQ